LKTDPFENVVPFVLTADAKSFATAARRLGVNPSSVSRAVARLEAQVGVKLLLRTSRSVSLTAEGQAFLDLCREVLEKMDRARNVLAATQTELAGTLRVTMPIGLGSAIIMPAMPRFLEQHGDVSIQVSLTDRWVDLIHENFDVAVRIGPLPDSGLFASKVGDSRFVVVGAPAYFALHDAPQEIARLVDHRCLKYTMFSGINRAWRFRPDSVGRIQEIDVPAYIAIDNGEAIVRAAVAGLGIAYVPDYMARASLEAGLLEEIFVGQGDAAGEIYCVHPGSRHLSGKVRIFKEFLLQLLAPR
jgi:LysR family transcriptional regulator for bpeEF and oprC